jgi:hypothetical protein
METAYFICACIGGTFIVCQFALTLIGLGGHDLVGGDHIEVVGHDAGSHDAGGHTDSNWFAGLLTLRTASGALAFFGLAGIICQRAEMNPLMTFAIAIGAGSLAMFLVAWVMKALVELNIDGTVRIENALSCSGTVYLPIPAEKASPGKVIVSVMERSMELKAVSNFALSTGTPIVVVAIVASDTVEVAPQQT